MSPSNIASALRPEEFSGEPTADGVVTMRWAGQQLDLYAGRAAFWKTTKTLIIADPHFGKAAAFRASGVPVPAGTTQSNLDRLTTLLDRTQAQRLIVLGDFLHAAAGRAETTMNALACWRVRYAHLPIVLVRGNHDQRAGDPPCDWNITCVDEPFNESGLSFRHFPHDAKDKSCDDSTDTPSLAGHLHPCVILRGRTGISLRAACFHFSKTQAILPAFGAFTGMHPIAPRAGDRIFALDRDSILEVKTVSA